MTAPKFLRPFWRYYGAKWRAAPRYPKPMHDTIVEPFAGAAGYSLRHYERRVILVECYKVIAEIWRWLIGAAPEDVLRVPLVDRVDDLPPETPLGARHLVGFAMNAGASAPCRVLSSGRRKLREMGRVFEGWSEAQRDRVAEQVPLIKHWTVLEGDYTSAPDLRATWFVDPPYERAGVHYKHGSDEIDFAALGTWCRSRCGQVIVCESEDATWLPFEPAFAIKASPLAGRAHVSYEAMWHRPCEHPTLRASTAGACPLGCP